MGYVCPFVLSNFTNFKLRKDHIYNFQFPHNIAEILRKLALNTNQSINQCVVFVQVLLFPSPIK